MTYSRTFYSAHQAVSATSAANAVPTILELLHPSSVIDVGCGTGEWLQQFMSAGVNVLGVDGPWVLKSGLLKIPRERFIEADLTNGVLKQSGLASKRHDLCISLEVAEHLPADCADEFVEFLISCSDNILFSAAIPAQGGSSHMNEQWPSYWAAKFSRRGYLAVDILRGLWWNNREIAPWYRQNILFYTKSELLPQYKLRFRGIQQQGVILDVVHPDIYQVKLDYYESKEYLNSVSIWRLGDAFVSNAFRAICGIFRNTFHFHRWKG